MKVAGVSRASLSSATASVFAMILTESLGWPKGQHHFAFGEGNRVRPEDYIQSLRRIFEHGPRLGAEPNLPPCILSRGWKKLRCIRVK